MFRSNKNKVIETPQDRARKLLAVKHKEAQLVVDLEATVKNEGWHDSNPVSI